MGQVIEFPLNKGMRGVLKNNTDCIENRIRSILDEATRRADEAKAAGLTSVPGDPTDRMTVIANILFEAMP